ncbi:MAG TPA: histidine kinase dimerization/phospho-acceptor domain-containing protein [Longimicrobiales bacterium]
MRQTLNARANRYDVVSRLADDLAHEIKNPLNAIVVNLEVLRRKIDTGATQVALERTHVIDEEIARLHLLVDQLLQLMRPGKGDGRPTVLDETLEDLRPLLEVQAKAARAGFELQSESAVFVKAASDAVKFTVLNLITAIYAAPEVEHIRIVLGTKDDVAAITIAATPSTLEEPNEFVQAARTLIEAAGGTLEIADGAATLRIPTCSSFA